MFFKNKSENTIFIIWENSFNQRDYHRLGIEGYEQNGWDIKIILCEPILYPRSYKLENYKSLVNIYENIFICKSIFQVLKKLFIFRPKWTFDFATSISKENYFKRIILLTFFSIFSKRIILNLLLCQNHDIKKINLILNFSSIKNNFSNSENPMAHF